MVNPCGKSMWEIPVAIANSTDDIISLSFAVLEVFRTCKYIRETTIECDISVQSKFNSLFI